MHDTIIGNKTGSEMSEQRAEIMRPCKRLSDELEAEAPRLLAELEEMKPRLFADLEEARQRLQNDI